VTSERLHIKNFTLLMVSIQLVKNQRRYPVHCWYRLESGSFSFSFLCSVCHIYINSKWL